MTAVTVPLLDLSGRVVLVTGASSGLGRRFARLFAAVGARVAAAARRLDDLVSLQAEIEAGGGQALAVPMDVADEASVIAGFNAVEEKWGTVDSVIANAGVNVRGRSVDLTAEAFDAVFGVNVRGVFLTVREGARRMIAAGSPERRQGRIVLVSSIGGHTVLPGLATYCASKAATLMLGKSLAREWARQGINVNILCPGYIETELNSDWFGTDSGRKYVDSFPRRRLMREDDLDAMILYLASDGAAAVTGSVFTLDDGQSL